MSIKIQLVGKKQRQKLKHPYPLFIPGSTALLHPQPLCLLPAPHTNGHRGMGNVGLWSVHNVPFCHSFPHHTHSSTAPAWALHVLQSFGKYPPAPARCPPWLQGIPSWACGAQQIHCSGRDASWAHWENSAWVISRQCLSLFYITIPNFIPIFWDISLCNTLLCPNSVSWGRGNI